MKQLVAWTEDIMVVPPGHRTRKVKAGQRRMVGKVVQGRDADGMIEIEVIDSTGLYPLKAEAYNVRPGSTYQVAADDCVVV